MYSSYNKSTCSLYYRLELGLGLRYSPVLLSRTWDSRTRARTRSHASRTRTWCPRTRTKTRTWKLVLEDRDFPRGQQHWYSPIAQCIINPVCICVCVVMYYVQFNVIVHWRPIQQVNLPSSLPTYCHPHNQHSRCLGLISSYLQTLIYRLVSSFCYITWELLSVQ